MMGELVRWATVGAVMTVGLAACLWLGVNASDWTKVAAAVVLLAGLVPVLAWLHGNPD